MGLEAIVAVLASASAANVLATLWYAWRRRQPERTVKVEIKSEGTTRVVELAASSVKDPELLAEMLRRWAEGEDKSTPARPGGPAKGDIETYYEDGQWKNRPQGSQRASTVHDTKAEAEAAGRQMATQGDVEHVIKKKDGTIGERKNLPP